jgi:hypothetical protein
MRLVLHLFRMLKALGRRHPVKFTLFYLCLLFLLGVEVSFNFAAPPTQDWIAQNLRKIRAEDSLELFKQYNVSHVFASHIHGYYQGQWQGIPYTITGGAGAQPVGKGPKHDFFHYIKVSVKGNTVDMAVQPIPSPDYEWLDRLGSIAWLYVFSFVRFHGVQLALFLLMAYLLGAALRTDQRENVRKR